MTTNESTHTYVLTECRFHGTTEAYDLDTMRALLPMVNLCAVSAPHVDEHIAYGETCWVCCQHMVIDPHGVLDY